MTVEQRVATEYREVPADEPGIVVEDDGSTVLVKPSGARVALPAGGLTSIPGPLPTPSLGTEGDVLTLDSGLDPTWAAAIWNTPPVNVVQPLIGVVSEVAGGTPGDGDWIGLVDLGAWQAPSPDGNGTVFTLVWESSVDGGVTWATVGSHSTDPSIQVTTATQYRLQLTAANSVGSSAVASNVLTIS